MEFLEKLVKLGGTKHDIVFLLISALALIVSCFDLLPLPFDAAWVAIVLCGLPIILAAVHGLVTAFDIKADVLVSMALVAAVIVDEKFAAGEVAFIMQLGALLEDLTVARARAGIEKLVQMTPRSARVVSADGSEKVMPAEDVQVGDLLRVLPGETVAVDGVVISGTTSINQAVMTGESLPVDKTVGDEVFSGTVNQFGSFDMRAEKVGEDSSLQRMIRLVQSADAQKARIVSVVDRWATWIVVIALVSALGCYFVTKDILRSVTILVVFCPCALVLATPTAIMASIGNATRHRFLVREGDALERLAEVEKVCFDKTGTLTCGTPAVTAVHSLSEDYTEEDIYKFAACAEHRSEHPLGKAVVECFKSRYGMLPFDSEDFTMIPGRGVTARVDDHLVSAGNLELLHSLSLEPDDTLSALAQKYLNEGDSVIFIVVDKKLVGMLALADILRPEAPATIADMKSCGVKPVLLTGDHAAAAQTIAARVNIDEVHPECLPEDKLHYIEKHEKMFYRTCMIGDGINDAPALKRARVGIAMGGIGSDIAINAADIVLVDDDVHMLPHVFRLARRTMHTIKVNLTFSMVLNFIAIALAMTGILNPVTGALVHNFGSVLVIINAIFLLNWESEKKTQSAPVVSAA